MAYDWHSDLRKLERAYGQAESDGDYGRCEEIVKEIRQIEEIIQTKGE